MTEPAELTANGVNGRTGEYLIAPVSLEQAARGVAGRKEDEDERALVDRRTDDLENQVAGTDPSVTVSELNQAGWGIIFNANPARADEVSAIRQQLEPPLARGPQRYATEIRPVHQASFRSESEGRRAAGLNPGGQLVVFSGSAVGRAGSVC